MIVLLGWNNNKQKTTNPSRRPSRHNDMHAAMQWSKR